MMNTKLCNSYLEILKEELVPALGCTEPIAIAYTAAKAREFLNDFPISAVLECSGNIIKNVKSVAVPNTDGLTGIRASMLAGLIGGKAEKQMEVLADLTHDHLAEIKRLLKTNFCEVRLLETEFNLHIVLHMKAESETVSVEMKHAHSNICRIEKNGQVIYHNNEADKYLGTFTDRSILSVKNIYKFANTVPLERVERLIGKQVEYNIGIAEEGLRGNYGINIGRALLAMGHADLVQNKMKAYAAAASEARMSGCALPVFTNSGSGNQGITTSVPVIIYARENNFSYEKLVRSLVFSNLLTIHQKTRIGRLSAFCGAVSAACSSGAAITYLEGGTLEQIKQTIHNTLANVSGIVCDGAKPSCAAKIASCLEASYLSHVLAMNDQHYQAGNGILKNDVEDTIAAVGHIACHGMRTTDTEILKVMLGNS